MVEQGSSNGEGARPLDAFRRLWKPSDDGFVDALTPPQRSVLSVLVIHANEDGLAWPSHTTIAKASGLGRSTVVRVLGQLVDNGAIIRTSRPPQSTRYTVSLWDGPAAGQSRSETETVPLRDFDRPAAGHELLKELPKELIHTYALDFETIWTLHPRGPKSEAHRDWQQAVPDLISQEDLERYLV